MNESEEGTVSSSEDECEEKSTQEGGTDEEEEGALPQLNIKGPGKVNIKHSQGVHIGSKINMEIKVGKVIVQSEGAIQQQPDRHAIAGTDNLIQELVENAVARHFQNLLADKVKIPLPIQSAESLMSEVEDISNEDAGQPYLVEEPPDENIVPCSSHQGVCQNNEVRIGNEHHVVTVEMKGSSGLNQSAETSNFVPNMATPELNQFINERLDHSSSPPRETNVTTKPRKATENVCQTEENVQNFNQTQENVQNASQTEENVQNISQTEENVQNVSQTGELFNKELLLENFLKDLVDCIQNNSLSEIKIKDEGKKYIDSVSDPVGYMIYLRCKDGRLSDFSTLHLKSIKQFEITDNSVIMELALSFSMLEYSFNEFTIYWSVNLPGAFDFTIKGNAGVSVQDNSLTLKLVFMYNALDNGRPLVKLIEDVHLERVQVNVTRYPDEEELNINDQLFLDYLNLYLSYEYLSDIKQYIVGTMNQAIDHLVTSDNSFRQTILQILDYHKKMNYNPILNIWLDKKESNNKCSVNDTNTGCSVS